MIENGCMNDAIILFQKGFWDLFKFEPFPDLFERRWRSGLERSSRKRKVGCSSPSRDRPISLKEGVKTPLSNALQLVRVSRVLGDDHYKRMPRVKIGSTLKNPHCSKAKRANSQPFTGKGDVPKWVKNSRVGRKTEQQKKKKVIANVFWTC